MTVQIIDVDRLRTALSFEDLIEPVAHAFAQSSAGRAESGALLMYPLADRAQGDVLVKTGTIEGSPVYIVKVAPWFAANVAQGQPQGGFLAVFDSRTGRTLALLDDQHYLSDIRTAAAGALSARLLAPARVDVAAVLGAGVQAYWQVLALYHERPFARLHIWARNAEKAANLAHRLRDRLPEVEIAIDADLQRVVEAGDVLITATVSREPLVRGDWLRPGQHVTAVGADDPTKCELDAGALRRARVFVDCRDAASRNGDICRAISTGAYRRDAIAGEMGDLIARRLPPRLSPDDITIAKFVGIGAQDLMAARVAMTKFGLHFPASD